MNRNLTNISAVVLAMVLGLSAGALEASMIYEYDLLIFTNDGLYADDASMDFNIQVSSPVAGQVRFEFHNDSPAEITSSIAELYFDDDALLLTEIVLIDEGPGTSFSLEAIPPNLPAGNLLTPPFETNKALSANANPPPSKNGVNPGEYVAIVFDLSENSDLEDVRAALDENSLRVGVHLIAFPDGSSESAVIPEPATLLVLVISGLLALGSRALKGRRRAG